jgi:HSP20 family protein
MNLLTRWEPFTRWNPWKDLDELQARLATTFGHEPMKRHAGDKEALTLAEWAPLVDITEDEKEFLVKAELPEVKREDVKVTVENGTLTIAGERKFEKEEKNKKYHRVERGYGQFTRAFTLPETADPNRINAEIKDGMLTVHLTKTEKAQPKAVDVKVN